MVAAPCINLAENTRLPNLISMFGMPSREELSVEPPSKRTYKRAFAALGASGLLPKLHQVTPEEDAIDEFWPPIQVGLATMFPPAAVKPAADVVPLPANAIVDFVSQVADAGSDAECNLKGK